MDDQVKINGFRIELAEIENVYNDHEFIDQAVAVVRENKLIVYLKAKPGVVLTKHALSTVKDFVKRSLTYYMIPRYLFFKKKIEVFLHYICSITI